MRPGYRCSRGNSRGNKCLAKCVQIVHGPERKPCNRQIGVSRHPLDKVEGLVDLMVRGSSSLPGRIRRSIREP